MLEDDNSFKELDLNLELLDSDCCSAAPYKEDRCDDCDNDGILLTFLM